MKQIAIPLEYNEQIAIPLEYIPHIIPSLPRKTSKTNFIKIQKKKKSLCTLRM
jgi:hypothetical protein